jgi:hypothetical protein
VSGPGNHRLFCYKNFESDQARVQPVLHVVDGVGDVVGPVHDLRFQAEPSGRRPLPDPLEDPSVLGVHAVFPVGAVGEPGVLERRVECGAGQVEAGPGDLRFEPGEQAQRLGVSLETTQSVQRGLAVVAERAVPDVVRQARGIHQVRVAPYFPGQFPADLRALKRMRQPGPGTVSLEGSGPGRYHLCLAGQATQRGTVQNPGTVPLEVAAPGPLGWLSYPAGRGVSVVTNH